MNCKYCGKAYIKNTVTLDWIPEVFRDKIKEIPDCNCYIEKKQEELIAAEKEKQKATIIERVNKYKKLSMIGPKFKNSTFEKANMEEIHMKIAKRYADNFTKNNISKGLLLYGPSGVGKTYATCCIANSLMQQQKAVLVLNLGLYIGELKVNWDQAEQALLKAVENCDLLIIDDFGAEQSLDINKSNWRSEKIYNLIDCCYRNEKPLILSTNLNYSKENTKCQISNSFPDRIKSRILDMCFPVSVIGKNKRGLEEFEFMELLK